MRKTLPSKVKDVNMDPMTGGGFEQPRRFPNLIDLMGNYEHCRTLRNNETWINIIKQYKRIPYKRGKETLPNFGSLRGRVDKALTTYTDFATERPNWAKVDTDFGFDDGTNQVYSRHIEAALQRFCFDRWKKSFLDIMLGCSDMLLFSKGAFAWLDDDCVYPENIDIAHVWPDAGAGMDVDTWSICHLHRRIKAVDLYGKIKDIDDEDDSGWNANAVKRLLHYVCGGKDSTLDSMMLAFENNSVSSSNREQEVDVIFSFVKEFNPDSLENAISVYAFPSRRFVPRKDKKSNAGSADVDAQGYLFYKPFASKKMSERIQIIAPNVFRDFYNDPSYAQQLYTLTKTYDLVMSRILSGVEENMRVYLKSSSSEVMRKLQSMRHGNHQVLDPSIDLIQQRIQVPVQEAMTALRMLIIDQSSNNGDYLPGGTDERNAPKTAHQAGLDFNESRAVTTSQLKVFNAFFTGITHQIAVRFLSKGESEPVKDVDPSPEDRNYKKFIAYLKAKHVPKDAFATENLIVTSAYNAGAGSPSAQLQAAQVVFDALSRNPASEGERQAQRDMIASVKGISGVSAYIPDNIDTPVGEDSLIGLENDALSAPGCNPNNIIAQPQQLHLRHIVSHVHDAEVSIQTAAKLFQSISQFPSSLHAVYMKSIQDILIGIDNKLSHAQAHMQLALKDKNKNKLNQLKALAARIGNINKMQDQIEHNLMEAMKSLPDAQPQSSQQMDLAHKQSMYQLEQEHAATMLAFDAQRSRSKAEQLSQQSKDRAEVEAQIKANRAELENYLATLKAATEIKTKRLK